MRNSHLLGIGVAAFLCALPLAAQDRPQDERPQPEETLEPLIVPETEIEGIETEEVVIPEINIPEVRVPEIRIPKIVVPNITIPEIRISREQLEMMDDEEREEFQRDMEEMRRDLMEQREELRKELREQRGELRRNLEKLRREVQERQKELERLREKTSRDSSGMKDALNDAQQSLEMAQKELAAAETARASMLHTLPYAGSNGAFAITPDGDLFAGAFAPMAEGGHGAFVLTDSSLRSYYFSSGDPTSPNAKCRVFVQRFTNGDTTLAPFPSMPDMPSMPHNFAFAPGAGAGTVMVNGDTVMILNEGANVTTNENGVKKQVRVFVRGGKGEGNTQTKTRVVIIDGYNEVETDTDATAPEDENEVVVEKRIIRNSPDDNASADAGYSLSENRPNPFDNSTTIDFTLGRAGHALLTIFDATGKVVRTLLDEDLPAGEHSVKFDAGELPNGLYLYRLASGGYSETRTMTLQK